MSFCRGRGTGVPVVPAWGCSSITVPSAPLRFPPAPPSLCPPSRLPGCIAWSLMLALLYLLLTGCCHWTESSSPAGLVHMHETRLCLIWLRIAFKSCQGVEDRKHRHQGGMSSRKGWSGLGRGCPRRWWTPHAWRCPRNGWRWH